MQPLTINVFVCQTIYTPSLQIGTKKDRQPPKNDCNMPQLANQSQQRRRKKN